MPFQKETPLSGICRGEHNGQTGQSVENSLLLHKGEDPVMQWCNIAFDTVMKGARAMDTHVSSLCPHSHPLHSVIGSKPHYSTGGQHYVLNNTVLCFIFAASFRAEGEVRTVRNRSEPGNSKRCTYWRRLGAESPHQGYLYFAFHVAELSIQYQNISTEAGLYKSCNLETLNSLFTLYSSFLFSFFYHIM